MIKNLKNLKECENELQSEIQNINLLGEISLTIDEVNKLGNLIREKIEIDLKSGIDYIKIKTPACLAVFLVWKGIIDYKDGDYWSAVKDSIIYADANYQKKWGEIFLKFLKSKKLSSFIIQGTDRYITPIIIHGMIPNSCLDEYFEKVLLPIVNHELLKTDDLSEVNFILENKREEEKHKEQILNEIKQHKIQRLNLLNKLENINALINIWNDLEKIELLKRQIADYKELKIPPDNIFEIIKNKEENLNITTNKIENLGKEKEYYCIELKKYSLKKQNFRDSNFDVLYNLDTKYRDLSDLENNVKSIENEIKDKGELLTEGNWKDSFIEIVACLPLEKLEEKTKALRKIKKNDITINKRYTNKLLFLKNRIKELFDLILTLRIRKKTNSIQNEILGILMGIPINKKLLNNPLDFLVIIRNLKSLCTLRSNLKHTIKLKNDEINNQINKSNKVTPQVKIECQNDISSIISTIKEETANDKKAQDIEIIIQKFDDEIQSLTDKKLNLDKELSEINNHLSKLGKGDKKKGIETTIYNRDTLLEIESIKNSLNENYDNLEYLTKLKQEAQNDNKSKDCFISERDHTENEIKIFEEKYFALQIKFSKLIPFDFIDEPIRRFLLYGGGTSSEFLFQSVKMYSEAKNTQMFSDFSNIKLPDRVVERFKYWFAEYNKNNDSKKNKEEREYQTIYKKPVLIIDQVSGEIKIDFPTQIIPKTKNGIRLCINKDKYDSQKIKLKTYKYSESLYETENIQSTLYFPAPYYEITLMQGDNELKSWVIDGIDYNIDSFMLFNYFSRKKIEEEKIYKGKFWIIIPDNSTIILKDLVIESGELYGKWKQYKYYSIDLINKDKLFFINAEGKEIELLTIAIAQEEPSLQGNNYLKESYSNGNRIYIDKAPNIRMYFENENEIDDWAISIACSKNNSLKESKHYKLKDLIELLYIEESEKFLEIPLSGDILIGKNPAGEFTIRLRNYKLDIIKDLSFSIIPYLNIKFAKEIYLPDLKGDTEVIFILELSEKFKFLSHEPAKIINYKNNAYQILTFASEPEITGIIEYSSTSNTILIPVLIKIPRLTWRIIGLDNNKHATDSNKIEEIWIGDLEKYDESLSLIIDAPSHLEGEARIKLSNIDASTSTNIIEGKARFDLSKFSDSLRKSMDSIVSFELTIFNQDSRINNVKLFDVRTKWEVEDLECEQKFDEEKLILYIYWKTEKGKPDGAKMLRLWDFTKPNKPIITEKINKTSKDIYLEKDKEDFPNGFYLIQLDIIDPWSGGDVSFPGETSLNTKKIHISHEEIPPIIYIVEVLGEKLETYYIRKHNYKIKVLSKIISSKLPPDIEETGLDIRQKNEGWYVGELQEVTKPGLKEELDLLNPIKFEYNPDKKYIVDLEDKVGDGAYYCPICEKIFGNPNIYEDEEKKGHKKHLLMGNIRFIIKK